MEIKECPNCGKSRSLKAHCPSFRCLWYVCTYCKFVSNGEEFFIDTPSKR